MRMRRKPWTEIELAACPFLIDLPSTHIGTWRSFFRKDQPVHLEIGCGKGVATAKMAHENPDINYIAIDEVRHVLAVSVRNVHEAYGDDPIDNIVFSAVDAMMIHDTFNAEDGIERVKKNTWRGNNKVFATLLRRRQALACRVANGRRNIKFKRDCTRH